MFRAIKDKALAATAIAFIRPKIARYGELHALEIHTGDRRAQVVILLKGEEEPTQLTIGRYELVRDGETAEIRFYEFDASRDWIRAAMEDFVGSRSFELPPVIARLL
jgi:hypothetical protein